MDEAGSYNPNNGSNDSGHKTIEYVVKRNEAGRLVQNFLIARNHDEKKGSQLTRKDILNLFKNHMVYVNDRRAKDRKHVLAENDVVKIIVEDKIIRLRIAKNLGLKVVHFDTCGKRGGGSIVVAWKPTGTSLNDVKEYIVDLLYDQAFVTEDGGKDGQKLLLDEEFVPIYDLKTQMNGLALLAQGSAVIENLNRQIERSELKFEFRMLCHHAIELPDNKIASFKDIKPHNSRLIGKDNGFDNSIDTQIGSWLDCQNLTKDILNHITIKVEEITQSLASGKITTVTVSVRGTKKGQLVVKKILFELGYPAIGAQLYTVPLQRGSRKGLFIALIGIEFKDMDDKIVSIKEPEPKKFESARARESKFFQRKFDSIKQSISDNSNSNNNNTTLPTEMNENGHIINPLNEISFLNEVTYDPTTSLPAAYIVGTKDFCGHKFKVSKDTLIPRKCTEALVNASISHIERMLSVVVSSCKKKIRILDLGTGTGCILLSILKHDFKSLTKGVELTGVGIDISPEALNIAQTNIELHGLSNNCKLLKTSFTEVSNNKELLSLGPFDIVVCNPPYHSKSSLDKFSLIGNGRSASGILHEPLVALVADGNDDFSAYKDIRASLSSSSSISSSSSSSNNSIIYSASLESEITKKLEISQNNNNNNDNSTGVMASDGVLFLEIKKGTQDQVTRIFKGWNTITQLKDAYGYIRCLGFQKKPE
ncbi:hypothetical protein H4219_004826 [Mycoemilia scoparia]|uniref:Methyltransferase domain-containing protein n=1 Tax=Mycoemilia scoparia TaxID=417184 RepID=A0A9W8DQH7_9FUNG|nr:hypothetical protein H4219_004826 [Mycoemilia scoparia]